MAVPVVSVLVLLVGVVLRLANQVSINPYARVQAAVSVTYVGVALLLLWKRPGVVIGHLFGAVALAEALTFFSAEYVAFATRTNPGSLPAPKAVVLVGSWTWIVALGLVAVFVLLLFPDGRLPSPRWKPVAWVGGTALSVSVIAQVVAMGTTPLRDLLNDAAPGPTAALANRVGEWSTRVVTLCGALALVSLIARVRRAKGRERRQLVWFCAAGGILTLGYQLDLLHAALPWPLPVEQLSADVQAIAYPLLALALGVAVLAYGLYDVQLVLGRALLYLSLSVSGVCVYVVTAWVLGSLLGRGSGFSTIAATGAVAVAMQPIYRRLQTAVNHVVYGDRDDPYAVLRSLGAELQAASDPPAIARRIVDSLARALRLPYVAVEGTKGLLAEVGTRSTSTAHFPLVVGGEQVGQLHVGAWDPREGFTTGESQLLAASARHVAAAISAVQLTDELRSAREELIVATEDERRRIRNDLHDGLGPTLASVALGLDAAAAHLKENADLSGLLTELSAELQAAIENLRALVYGLRPPALDQLGLVGALQSHASVLSRAVRPVSVIVAAETSLGLLPAAVEVAAYRICAEAMTNVIRHAAATTCRVRLNASDDLRMEITDNGHGVIGNNHGVGMASMRRRTEELGGLFEIATGRAGTTVIAQLPLRSLKGG